MITSPVLFEKHARRLLLSILFVASTLNLSAIAGVTGVQQTASKITSISGGAGDKDYTKEALFTGCVSFPVTLVKVGNIEVQLQYNSNVHRQVRTENRVAPIGWIGLGWSLTLGSIVGDIAGTADSSDDHYHYIDKDGSVDIIKSSTGEFVLKQYRPWRITREVSGNSVIGWTIITEDGTVKRFGNYRLGSKSFSLSLDSSYATRCMLGFSGVVDNPPWDQYPNATLVPYQWDLSDIQDVQGNHTTIAYQQVTAQLSLPGHTPSQSYTRESHPWKISDNTGGEVEFVLADLNSDEYYGPTQSFTQNVYESKRLDTLRLKQNGQVYERILLRTVGSQDVTTNGAKKRYLTGIWTIGRALDTLKIAKYDYCGIAPEPSGANPGALRRVTFLTGGSAEYMYKAQRLPLDTLARTSLIPSSLTWTTWTTPSPTGTTGSDFYVIGAPLFWYDGQGNTPASPKPIQVFRRGPTGWYRDTSFPFDSAGFYQAGYDYIVGNFQRHWKVAQRSGEGWITFDLEAAIPSFDTTKRVFMGPIGLGPNYFVFKYNLVNQNQLDRHYSLAAVRFTESGLKVATFPWDFVELHGIYAGENVCVAHMWADCAENYFIVSSYGYPEQGPAYAPTLDTHFKWQNGTWDTLMFKREVQSLGPWNGSLPPSSSLVLPYTVPIHRIGKNFVACNYPLSGAYNRVVVYQHTGQRQSLTPLDTYEGFGVNTVALGDFFYGVGFKANGISPWFRRWDGAQWVLDTLRTHFPGINTNLNETSSFATGNRLVFVGNTNYGGGEVSVFSLTYDGSSWTKAQRVILPDTCDFPGVGGFSPNAFFVERRVGEARQVDQKIYYGLSCYTFIGDSLQCTPATGHTWAKPDASNHWFWQPGSSFVVSFNVINDIYNSWADTNHVYAQGWDSNGNPAFTDSSYDFVLDKKVLIPGTGDSIKTTYAFDNGSWDEQIAVAKYNRATVTLPGNAGKTVTLFYNDLGANQATEFVNAKNYLELDGQPYRTKDYDNANRVVREANQLWVAEPIDSTRGVFYSVLVTDSTLADSVAKVSSYEYGNPAHRQVTKITETNSGGTQRITRMKYPLDYSWSGQATNPTVQALDSLQHGKHVLNAVIERWVYRKAGGDTASFLAADLTKFKLFSGGRVLPWQSLKLRDSVVTDFTPSSTRSDSLLTDRRYIIQSTVDRYTAYGQELQVRDANNVATTTLQGYTSTVPVATIVNARTSQDLLGGECSYVGFESVAGVPASAVDSSDTDYWTLNRENSYNIRYADAHTGLYCQKVPGYSIVPETSNPRTGPIREFRPPDLAGQNRMYVVSCWVKTSAGFGAGAGLLCVQSKIDGASNAVYPNVAGASVSVSTGDTYGAWIPLEVRIDLKTVRQLGAISNGELLRIRVWVENHDMLQSLFVDDIRVYPLDGQVTATLTYDPSFLLPTSKSDASGIFTTTSYDGFGRVAQEKNSSGALLKDYSYFYSKDGLSGAFNASDPNFTKERTYRTGSDTTAVKTYTDGLGREIQKQVCFGDSDIVSATKYDSLNHPRYVYKPYQVGLGGSKHTFRLDFADSVLTYYSGLGITLGSTPFSETRYRPDPLNRVQSQGAPGDVFRVGSGHDITTDYSAKFDSSWNVTVTTDEQGDSTRVSKDLFGNTVRSVVRMGSADSLMTTFAYDVLGNLIKSTPPMQQEPFSSNYKYTTRSELREKRSPDAGTVSILYDRQGNVRLTRDEAHRGSGTNSVGISRSINPGTRDSANFPVNDRAKVTVTLNGAGVPVLGGSVTMKIRTTGGVTLATLVSSGTPQSTTLILPQGTYSYWIQSTATQPPSTPYAIQCLMEYPFTFASYDALGRVVQQGEYEASDATNFTQALADSTTFPSSSTLLTKTFFYDTLSTDVMAANQHNVKGRLSWASSYRLGVLAVTTFYSYDDMGRIEWVVQKGLGSASKKISYAYDLQGNIVKKTYVDAYNPVNNHSWWYVYDQAGRLASVYSGADSASRVMEGQYSTLASGRESQLKLGVAPAQTVSYAYTQRDWLKSLTSLQYWQSLGYDDSLEVGAQACVRRQYNGNISWMAYSETANAFSWGPPTTTTTVGYGFSYDKANRLVAAQFGYKYNNSWTLHNSYNMPYIGYDKNGNIDSLVRYGTGAAMMDNLKYKYLANSNRLDYIDDGVTNSALFNTDIDKQQPFAYRYDGNGNVQADTSRSMGLIVYDMNNLPVAEYRSTDGALIQYVYDANGTRVQKTVGAGSPVWYVGGSDGKTDVVYNGATTNPSYNVFGANGLIGQVKRTGAALNRQYHLKDHLGSVRVSVRGDSTVLADDFSGTLSQWTTVLGSGFTIVSGELSNSAGGPDNVAVNASSTLFADGVIGADVTNLYGAGGDANIVLRYQNTNNYYMVQAYNYQVMVFKKKNGNYSNVCNYTGSTAFLGGPYKLQATVSGHNIKVYWKGVQVLDYTDTDNDGTAWLSGKVGVRQCYSRTIHWDNFYAITTCPGQVAAYDDYYPFGQQMDTRCQNFGFADARYKYSEKERDAETGYDDFGVRYYDARVGRWLSTDPASDDYADVSPYCYALNNPMRLVDPTGMAVGDSEATKYRPPANDIVLDEVVVTGLQGSSGSTSARWFKAAAILAVAGAPEAVVTEPAAVLVSLVGTAILIHELYGGEKDVLDVKPWQVQDSKQNSAKGKRITGSEGKMAESFGKTVKEIKDAIHAAKRANKWGKNTDVNVDLDSGDIYPTGKDGSMGDASGNIHDYLK